MPTTTSRWRALAALLRPDAWRWVGLGALVAAGSGLILTGPLIVRSIVDKATTGTTAGQLTQAGGAVLDRGRRHPADQHGGGLDGHGHGMAHDQRHPHPPRPARVGSQPCVSPPAHTGRTDPARRWRRDIGLRLHGAGDPSRRRGAVHGGRHDRCLDRGRLAIGAGRHRLRDARRRRDRPRPPSRRRRIIGRNGRRTPACMGASRSG